MLASDNRKISIAIPAYNRTEMVIEAFEQVYFDERVSEIIIVDDASEMDKFNELKEMCEALPKVHLYRNITNQDCYANKMIAVSYCMNDFVILLDSDNKIDRSYIDKIFAYPFSDSAMRTPCFAKPHFDFTQYADLIITKENVAEYIDKPMLEVCLNAANYFVPKNKYCEVWDRTTDPVTSDSIYMAYLWLAAGNKIHIVDGLEYEHKVHPGSHYQNNVLRTPQGFHQSILNKLKELR